VGISGLISVAVVKHQEISITKIAPTGIHDDAGICGINWIAFLPTNIDRRMNYRIVVIPGNGMICRRPYK
jgi:hypothetical protein